jgi:hypothetical protein
VTGERLAAGLERLGRGCGDDLPRIGHAAHCAIRIRVDAAATPEYARVLRPGRPIALPSKVH